MTEEELMKAIEIAGEAVHGGFADMNSFEYLLAQAVLELYLRYKVEFENNILLLEEDEERGA